MNSRKLSLAAAALCAMIPAAARAQGAPSVSPYIDELREDQEETRPRAAEPSFTEKVKKGLPAVDSSDSNYIESLVKDDPDYFKAAPAPSYTEEKRKSLPPVREGGAIQAVREGRSSLEFKRPGEIKSAAGVRLGAAQSRNITASSELGQRSFSDVYGSGWAPDLSVFWEWQPFHSEWYGNLGIVGMMGLSYDNGQGTFLNTSIKNPAGETFDPKSKTKFQFFRVPATLALDYRFNLFRVVRPFVLAGPTVIHYAEMRSDRGFSEASKGRSWGYSTSVGASVLLDWISHESAWNYYEDYGVKHYYFTLEYSRLSTFSGAVDFKESGILAGMTFEL